MLIKAQGYTHPVTWPVFIGALVALALVGLALVRVFSHGSAWVAIPLAIVGFGLAVVVTAGFAILVHGFEPREAFIGAAVIEGIFVLIVVVGVLISDFF